MLGGAEGIQTAGYRFSAPDRRDRFSAHRLRKCRAISDPGRSRRFALGDAFGL